MRWSPTATGTPLTKSASCGRATRRYSEASHPQALAEALKVRPLMSALRAGSIEVSGLSELRRTRMGERLIRSPEFSETAWRAVRKNWAKPEVRAEFADLIGEHLDELIAEVRLSIESDPVGRWRERSGTHSSH